MCQKMENFPRKKGLNKDMFKDNGINIGYFILIILFIYIVKPPIKWTLVVFLTGNLIISVYYAIKSKEPINFDHMNWHKKIFISTASIIIYIHLLIWLDYWAAGLGLWAFVGVAVLIGVYRIWMKKEQFVNYREELERIINKGYSSKEEQTLRSEVRNKMKHLDTEEKNKAFWEVYKDKLCENCDKHIRKYDLKIKERLAENKKPRARDLIRLQRGICAPCLNTIAHSSQKAGHQKIIRKEAETDEALKKIKRHK